MFKKNYVALIILIVVCTALLVGLMILFYSNKISFFDSNPYGYILDIRTISSGFLVAASISILILSAFLYFKAKTITPFTFLFTLLIIGVLFIISSIILFLTFNLAFKESYSFYSGALLSSIVFAIIVGLYLLRKKQLSLPTKLFGYLMLLSSLALATIAILDLNNASLSQLFSRSTSHDVVKTSQENQTILKQGFVYSANESTENNWIAWDKSFVQELNKYGYASTDNLMIISNNMQKNNTSCPKNIKQINKRGSIIQIVYSCGIFDKQYRIDTILNKSICCERYF